MGYDYWDGIVAGVMEAEVRWLAQGGRSHGRTLRIKPGDKILTSVAERGLMYDFTWRYPRLRFSDWISQYAKSMQRGSKDSIITGTPESFHGKTIYLIWFFPSTRSTTSRTSTLIPHSRKWRGLENKRSISASSLTETRRKKPICYIGN